MNELPGFPWWRRDATLIAILTAMAIFALAIAFFYSRSYKVRQQALAQKWSQRGNSSLSSGQAAEAVRDFRTALGYSPDNPEYLLHLAQALAVQPAQADQAIAYFLNLWEEKPGDGLYNLELARLYARKEQVRAATQYYTAAISGAWAEDPAGNRRRARLEYIQFLLQHNSLTLAEAEAITLAAGVPASDVNSRFVAADTLLQVREYERSIAEYLSLVGNDRARATAGAGNAAFLMGRFRSASKYLDMAIDSGNKDPRVATRLAQAKQIVSVDPTERGTGSAERARRAAEAYNVGGARLKQCSATSNQPLEASTPTTELQQLFLQWKEEGRSIPRSLRESDSRDRVMDLVFRIENTTARMCGTPTGGDWPLWMLGRYGDRVQQ